MPLVNDPDLLSQGALTVLTDIVFGTPIGNAVTITSVLTEFPTLASGDFIEIREHSNSQNNGLYEVTGTPTAGSVDLEKVGPTNPVVNAVGEAAQMYGNSAAVANEKSIMYDTATKLIYIITAGNVSTDGVTMLAIHSFTKEEWINDNFLRQFRFPMIGIDFDAGKWEFGVDPSGNFSGWRLEDDIAPTTDILSRRLIRGAGWIENDASGNVDRQYAGIVSLGTFEDPVNDKAYFQLGLDPTDTSAAVDFQFFGPVNEPILFFDRLPDGQVNGGTGVAISTDGRVLTRSDGGNWVTDGFIVGGKMRTRTAENTVNNTLAPDAAITPGFLISAVQNSVNGTITFGTAAVPVAANAPDFIDGAGGNDQIVRNDGISWKDEGYFVGGHIQVANATTIANDGPYTILAISTDGTTIDVATASFTADTDDTTATFGPFNSTGTPDTTINVGIKSSTPTGRPSPKPTSRPRGRSSSSTSRSNSRSRTRPT
jgi:hypothetical protein